MLPVCYLNKMIHIIYLLCLVWGGDCCSFAGFILTLQVIGSNVYRSMTIPTDFLVAVLSSCTHIQVSQDLMSMLRDLIPELILSQKVIYTWVQFATVQKLCVFKVQ